MKPKEEWPLVLGTTDLVDYVGLNLEDANRFLSLHNDKLVIPGKRRFRQISKRNLLEILEGGEKRCGSYYESSRKY